jgi:hypothetical protein
MQPLSTYAFLMSQVDIMNNTKALSQKYSTELSNGVQAVNLADNPNRSQILDLTGTENKKTAYLTSCTLGEVTTSSYSDSLSSLETVISNALSAVSSVKTSYTGIPTTSGSTDSNSESAISAYSDLSETIDQTMTEVTDDLNEQSATGNGYLYSGLRQPTGASTPSYTTPTVTDLTKLPYFLGSSSPAPDPAGTTISGYTPPTDAVDAITTGASGSNADLPTYDSDFASSRPAASTALLNLAYGTSKVTIDDNEAVSVGISSTSTTFQNLVNGLRAAKTAADQAGNYSTTDRDTFMGLAYSCLTSALAGIRSLETTNDMTGATLEAKASQHNDALTLINTRLDSIKGINTTTVTAQLAAANNQLTASYTATSSLLSLSLLTYLK